ncbi:hypothetical protein [Vibrio coralliirubri]|uniref:hypothetical protein n=1 Tax=Vibrio coralliirubri TaxID=1516159 RepID=UPI000B198359|nr:hypothetical protein [Vibrio coralliirubri]
MDTKTHQHPRVLTPFSRFIALSLYRFIALSLYRLQLQSLSKTEHLLSRIKAAQTKLS